MVDKSDKPEKGEEIPKGDGPTKAASGFRDEGKKSPSLNVVFAKYKGKPSSENVAALISVAEKKIKDFYGALTKRVSDFLDNEFKLLKDVSKEELAKMNAALLDYKTQLEKISQEKMKRVAEIKTKLQNKIMTAEEVQSFVKYFDGKMTEVMKITQNIIDTMRKSKIADSFATDLQSTITIYSKKVETAMDELIAALKDNAKYLSKSVSDKTTLATKIPTNSDFPRGPSMMNNIFKRMGGSSAGANDSDKSRGGPLYPQTLRDKLPTLNLSKHFNSRTLHGRANVAKATYLGAFLYFLYWKFKKSKS